jgi:hypothetical protein
MNLGATLSAIGDYYDAALTACGRPVCATYRYVGQVGVVSGPGRCDCTCGPAGGPCFVGDADDAVLSETGDNGVLADAFGGYCSTGGFVSMGVAAPHTATWTFTLTAENAEILNAYGGVWLRAAIGISPEDPVETIDPDQVTLDVNGVTVDIADLLNVYAGIPGITDMWVWPSNNVFVPMPGMTLVAGANTIVVTSVNRFNSGAAQSINVVAVDQVGIGADAAQVGDLTFEEDTGCMVACVAAEAPQGVLRVSWRAVGPSATPPTFTTAVAPAGPMMPWVELWVRVMRCWPTDLDTDVAGWDTAAAGIAADADCLMCATHDLLCMQPTAFASVGLEGCAALGGYRINPVWPDGGCAGNELSLYARLSCD